MGELIWAASLHAVEIVCLRAVHQISAYPDSVNNFENGEDFVPSITLDRDCCANYFAPWTQQALLDKGPISET